MVGDTPPAILIAAPASGSGKTVLTLALLRAFMKRGIKVGSFKVGPDYIDPAFHQKASARPCFNLDAWAMRQDTMSAILTDVVTGNELVIGEGVMGLFDGARDGSGSTADIAAKFGLPIVLVVDARGQSTSVGAVLSGFHNFRDDIGIAGVIFNKTGGSGHIRMLQEAADKVGIPVLGFVPRTEALALDHRHLGLVQARETNDLDDFLDKAADVIQNSIALDELVSLGQHPARPKREDSHPILPLGQNIAIAEDDAFSFIYPHLLSSWKAAGAALSFFSPLADQAPCPDADAIYLPGGYPELFCEVLAHAENFRAGMQQAAKQGQCIYGECGGFMVLGESLTDKDGIAHAMLDLLPIRTSFAKPKMHLGYRQASIASDCVFAKKGTQFKAHEFHYAELTSDPQVSPLFSLEDALQKDLGTAGAVSGNVAGSFIHIIDRMAD